MSTLLESSARASCSDKSLSKVLEYPARDVCSDKSLSKASFALYYSLSLGSAQSKQASTLFPRRDALGDIKDEVEENFDEDTWFTLDEKRNKMTKECIIELLEEFPLPPSFSARGPALQESANYGTDLETSVYEGQIRSGYRIPTHPFVVAFFNYYKMASGQLVPNGWRKLVGLIYLVKTSGYPVTVHDFMRLYLEVCFIKNVAKSVGWYYIHNMVRVIKGGPKPNKGLLAPNALTKKLIDRIKRRGGLSIDEPLTDQEMRHAGLIPPALTMPRCLAKVKEEIRLLRAIAKGFQREEKTGYRLRWTIKRGDSGMPSSHVSAHHLSHGVLHADKVILENQPNEAFVMAHVQAAYNVSPFALAYCYNSQMQDRFAMAMDVAHKAEAEKRTTVSKADRLGKEVDDLKVENTELLAKVNCLEKRCEKLKKAKADAGNKAIQAFLDGTAGEEWLRRCTEDGLSIFQEGFQKAKELTVAKYPSLFLDDIIVLTFESPSGETAAPTEAGDAIFQGERSLRSRNAPAP
ncbi:hypothetical protein RJ640_019527 [Escallonia rubra]|uniref:Transposase (putative) gypsy type domain-containing protein n=1 Tax=Escallonia rubra TaxID=112253 RepID=A0AA88QZM5_9ASTE|nr:hypothetical protein RJ640_019527 [Escallonia rubra]